MSAIIAARMADRMAELHRQMGQKKYTALDHARSIGLLRDGEVGGELKQQGVTGLRYKASNVNTEVTKYKNSKAISVEKGVVQKTESSSAISQALKKFEELYLNEQKVDSVLGTVIINKKSLKNSLAHGFSQKKLDASISLVEGMKQAAYIGSIEDLDNKNIDNHFFAYKINYSGQENIVFCRIKENAGQPMKLYIHEVVDVDTLKKRSSSLNKTASLENGSVSRQASEKMSTPRGLTLYNSILNQFLENLNQSYDQKAWHGTPYNFERFDIGKIGAGVGDQVHGWGLYFVKKMLKNQKSL